nr:cytochrome b [Lepidophthirus macrorhini]
MKTSSDLFMMMSKEMFKLPVPSNLHFMWNFGSMLGICLGIQITTGLLLSMHYEASTMNSFSSVVSICLDTPGGWLIRLVHANGASFMFMCVYMHMGRGLYYRSFNSLPMVWLSGVVIFYLMMMTAFMGYILPWGQMSYWGATVITNLISAIPYLGSMVVEWIWGGFSVENPTLVRFYSLHFLMPFVISGLVLSHLTFLHTYGSSNPLGVSLVSDPTFFHPYFSFQDLMGFLALIMMLTVVTLLTPDILLDPSNFSEANPMITPLHIQPEWYFLFAYSILRSIPSKLGGVVALALSVVLLLLMPMKGYKSVTSRFSLSQKLLFIVLVISFVTLTWLGAMPMEYPFTEWGRIMTIFYFMFYIFY